MAEDDVCMEKIQQSSATRISTTRKIYARFSPSYLRDATAALENGRPRFIEPESTTQFAKIGLICWIKWWARQGSNL